MFTWELARHAVAEELVLYPAMEQYLEGGRGRELAEKDRREHQTVLALILHTYVVSGLIKADQEPATHLPKPQTIRPALPPNPSVSAFGLQIPRPRGRNHRRPGPRQQTLAGGICGFEQGARPDQDVRAVEESSRGAK